MFFMKEYFPNVRMVVLGLACVAGAYVGNVFAQDFNYAVSDGTRVSAERVGLVSKLIPSGSFFDFTSVPKEEEGSDIIPEINYAILPKRFRLKEPNREDFVKD